MKLSVHFSSNIKTPKIKMPSLKMVSMPKIGSVKMSYPKIKTKFNLTNKQK